jgi:glycosyltransferase involved in cell wall biosynthesis
MINESSFLQITSSLEQKLGGPTFIVQDSSIQVGNRFRRHRLLVFGKVDIKVEAETLIIPTCRGNRFGLPIWIKLREVKDFMQTSNFILIHGFYLFSTLLAVSLSNSRTLFLMPHGSMEPHQEKSNKLRKFFFRLVFRLLTIRKNIVFLVASRREINGVEKLFPLRKVELAGYGVSFPKKEIECKQVPERDDFVIGYLGRIHPIKRLDLAIKCLPNLVDMDLGVRLRVAGEGSPRLLAELKALSAHLGVSDKIDFVGAVIDDSKEQFFEDIDLLLLLSDNENFAVVVAEAIIRGIPVVVRSTVAMSDFVAEWNTGVVVESEDVRAISAAIDNLISNYMYYSSQCLSHRCELSWSKVGKDWELIMSSHLEGLTE